MTHITMRRVVKHTEMHMFKVLSVAQTKRVLVVDSHRDVLSDWRFSIILGLRKSLESDSLKSSTTQHHDSL